MGCCGTAWKVLTRKKILDPITAQQTPLSRVLTTLDLTALGVGSTLGVGLYVIAGQVAKETAGPAVIVSFLIAGIASVFAGLCYAEFGARTPKAGSAYIYTYVCVGELFAFVIGWNLILEYVIGSASVARGLSGYLDNLINHTMQDAFIDIAPINISFLATYFDFFAFGISIFLAVALAFGMKESSMINNIVTFINIGVVVFTVIAGCVKADINNWKIEPNSTNTTDNIGKGGFAPFGIEGIIKGAATCFYCFVGFDCIATTGEEVKNPKRAIPISIIMSLLIIFLSFFGTSAVITLMIPYYEQDDHVPIPHAFEAVGLIWAKWIVAIGAIFGLCASLFGAMFPLPRIIYAMASDSLIFRFLGKVSERFQSPVIGTILSGILTGLMAGLFDMKQLVDMMSIGTLMAYTIVAASVLLLRYESDEKIQYIPIQTSSDTEDDIYTDNRMSTNADDPDISGDRSPILGEFTSWVFLRQLCNCVRYQYPTSISEKTASVLVFLYCIFCVGIGLCAMYLQDQIAHAEIWAIVLASVAVLLAVLSIIFLAMQPTSNIQLSFKVPLVPLIPALSIMVNIYLMLMLDKMTWIRFGIWMTAGLPVYYFSLLPPETKNTPDKIYQKHKELNGCDNRAFEFDEKGHLIIKNGNVKKRKSKAPIPPTETMRIKEQFVLEAFDKVLENAEENINQTNDPSPTASTCENSSFNLPNGVLENVVADVHNDNNPESLNPIYSNTSDVIHDKNNEDVTETISDSLNTNLENITLNPEQNNKNESEKEESKVEILENPRELAKENANASDINSSDTEESNNKIENCKSDVEFQQNSEIIDSSNNYEEVQIEDNMNNNIKDLKDNKSVSDKIANFGGKATRSQVPSNKKVKSNTQKHTSFKDVKLNPVKRPSLEKIKRESVKKDETPVNVLNNIPTPPNFPSPRNSNTSSEDSKDDKNVDEKQHRKHFSIRPSSFQLQNVKLKPVVKIKGQTENEEKTTPKHNVPNKPSSFLLRSIKLKPTKKPQEKVFGKIVETNHPDVGPNKNSLNKNWNNVENGNKPKSNLSYRPSSFQLKNIKLKSIQNETAEDDSTESEVFGVSEENTITKNKNKLPEFKQKLNNVLSFRKSPYINQYSTESDDTVLKNKTIPENTEVSINENVLEGNIDREDAKSKIFDFLQTRQNFNQQGV